MKEQMIEEIRKNFCVWYYAQSQPLDANKVFDWFTDHLTAEQGKRMTSERIKEIQSETAYPNSISVQQALLKVWNECEQSKSPELTVREVVDYIKKIGANNFTVWELHDWEFAISKNDSHRYIKSGETLDELTKIIRG